MPFQTVRLKPGVNVEATPTLLEAGYSASQLIRWRDGLIEKIGGWTKFFPFTISGIIRALHAWQDLDGNDRLGVGSTANLNIITNGAFQDITPQDLTSDFDPDFATTASSTTVTIDDPNISNVTIYDSIEFKTPVAIGGIVLSGVYAIVTSSGATSYTIEAATAATATRANLTISNITQANPGLVTYTGADNIANGDLVYIFGVGGMTEVNGTLQTVANLDTGANTFEIEDTSGFTAYTSGGSLSFGAVPRFTTTSGDATLTVTLQDHGLAVGDTINFPLSTSVGGLTIVGTYTVFSVADVDNFVITADTAASSSTSIFMNSGQAEIIYHITLGPETGGVGYGIGTYGTGAYGTGVTTGQQTGTAITATDWSLDNWGEIFLANPQGGGIYWWQSQTGYQNAKLVSEAPPYNNGLFVAMPAQILVAWGSTTPESIGLQQDPLLVRWSDQEDFFNWTVTITTQAGSFHIPTGSAIKGALQARNYAYIWTDLDLWAMNYLGPPLVYGFNKVAANCGLNGQHAVCQQGDSIYWMGRSNFFGLTAAGVSPVPCSVWDVVFQDIDTAHLSKCVAAPNTPFNEILFFYPSSSGGTGENDKYAKLNTLNGAWDYGTLGRTAWIDQSVLGMPIASATNASVSTIYSQESGYDADNQPITPSFTTGYWVMAEGEEFAFVDFVIPDFKYGTFSGSTTANLSVTFHVIDFPGDTPRNYGPYNVTSSTQFISTRFRGRQMAMTVSSSDTGSFWRIGAIRFRYGVDGRR